MILADLPSSSAKKSSVDLSDRDVDRVRLNNRSRSLDLSLFDAMRSPIVYIDQIGKIQYINAKALSWFASLGFKSGLGNANSLLGQSFIDLPLHWDNIDQCASDISQVLKTGKPIVNTIYRGLQNHRDIRLDLDIAAVKSPTGKVDGVILVIEDITKEHIKDRALEESEARYKAFISNSSDAVWRYDVFPPVSISLPHAEQVKLILERAVLVECNEKLAKLFGANRVEDVIGLPIRANGSLSNKRDTQKFVEQSYRLEDQEFTRIDQYDARLVVQTSAAGIIENKMLIRIWGSSRDVTSTKKYLDRLEFLATHDPLTSLPNRTLLYRHMDEAFEAAKKVSGPQGENQEKSGKNYPASTTQMAFLLIDLDRFKEINDTLGHAAGDKVLMHIGPRLEVELGDTPGTVARLGGDEFGIFLPRLRNHQQAVVFANRFLDCICQVFDIEGFRTAISASIGVALAPEQAQDSGTLMRYADVAMYYAKNHGHGVSVYDQKYDSNCETRLELMGALGSAIRENQLRLYYQPKVSLKDHKVYSFEALVRWRHPELGMVLPADFVPAAEMSSMIYPMTYWVLEETIKQCALWREAGFPITVAMNLSARTLMDDRIVLDLYRLLGEYNLSGDDLEMEITESTIMSDPARAQMALERISSLGVTLSVDDFGTGYSSLAYLKRLPVKTLKIDGSFVQGMIEDDQDEIIVKSTIQLAHNLGLEVVAEGVESREVYLRLSKLGCDSAQGFFFAKPLDAKAAQRWMRESEWRTTIKH